MKLSVRPQSTRSAEALFQELHLVDENSPVGQDEILRTIWDVGHREQSHFRFFGRTRPLGVVAATAGGYDVAPAIGATAGERYKMITGELGTGKLPPAVHAQVSIAQKQFSVR